MVQGKCTNAFSGCSTLSPKWNSQTRPPQLNSPLLFLFSISINRIIRQATYQARNVGVTFNVFSSPLVFSVPQMRNHLESHLVTASRSPSHACCHSALIRLSLFESSKYSLRLQKVIFEYYKQFKLFTSIKNRQWEPPNNFIYQNDNCYRFDIYFFIWMGRVVFVFTNMSLYCLYHFAILPLVFWRCNWHTALCTFKVYRQHKGLPHVLKWIPHLIHHLKR